MANFEKPLHDFTEDELQQKINQWDPRFGVLAQYELQRRLQTKNTEQITDLVKELKKLKSVTEKNSEISKQNAESDRNLSRKAITIAAISLLAQVLFGMHQDMQCRFSGTLDDSGSTHFQDCYKTFDLGILGTYTFKVKDFTVPK